ncbi:AI-2E family transporter [uncultured Sunxiuqinia sp.]|uniref:AI-2E family transporter n=1 Tax=uncultured Sunxiuqinia sp. TaxID=1573825 RepID=UPI0026222262|nr:AI-2E family transporter [uncultured Sunxiuqinia sp.]
MKNQALIRFAAQLFILTIFFIVLILAKDILIPLAISIFLAYTIYPLVWAIEKRGVHRGLSIVVVLLVTLLILMTAGLFISAKLSNMTINLSELKTQMDAKIDTVQHMLEIKAGINPVTMDHYLTKATDSLFSSWQSAVGSLFAMTTNTLILLGLLPFYTFFLLFYRTKTAHFIFRIVGRDNKAKALHIMREVSTITTKYMSGLLIVVLILAILNSTGLLIIGIPNAIAFGILAAVLNLIPYIGTFIGGLIPILYVLLTSANPFEPILQIFILFSVIQFLENNLITPNIVGSNIKINPLSIILSLLFANLIWGVAGMLIVVPCLAILKIIMRNIDGLKPYAFLISDRGVDQHQLSVKRIWKKRIKRK